MKILLFACADSCVTDAQTNRVSLFNLVEEMNAPGFPAIQQSLNILSMLEREETEPSSVKGRLTLTLNGQVLLDTGIEFAFQDKLRCRSNAILQGLPVEAPGLLQIELRVGKLHSTWRVKVGAMSPPAIVAPVKERVSAGATKIVKAKKAAKKKKVAKKR